MLIKTHESLIDVIQAVATLYKGIERDVPSQLHMYLEGNMITIDNVRKKLVVTFEPEFDYVRGTAFRLDGSQRVFTEDQVFNLNRQRPEMEDFIIKSLAL